jgi:hypothetical protein
MKVTFRQIREGKTLSLAECFTMEYRMSQAFMVGARMPVVCFPHFPFISGGCFFSQQRDQDFYEGIRSRLWHPLLAQTYTNTNVYVCVCGRVVLIDRDNNPAWKHKRIEDVTAAEVDVHFQPLENDLILV